jgi:hypothetical protein
VSLAPGTVQFDGPNAPGGRLHVDGGTGNVGVGTNAPGEFRLHVNGRARLGGSTDHREKPVLSLAPGTVHFDAPNVVGGRLVIDGTNGRVGIGAPQPRSEIDLGKGLLTGSPNDYLKGQFTLSGGGTVTWAGPGGRLKWTNRFIAISAERGPTFADGYVDIVQPTTPIPAANVYDGAARAADANGVVLNHWDALYAVHPVGGGYTSIGYQIRHYTKGFVAPSNWILVAVVNGDDSTVKLGTGTTLAARASYAKGSPIPSGTIVMWSGSTDNIPDGWGLCDGQNSTPDLRGRFVMATDGSAAQAPGKFGEPDVHTHGIDMPAFTVGTTADGAHTHPFYPSWYKRNFGGGDYSGIDTNGWDVKQSRTAADGSHAHNVKIDLGTFESHGALTGRPRWYALCFIMKLY